METTGQIVRQTREKKGMLLRELAAELEIDSAILSKIERGDRRPPKELIVKIALILNLNEKELIMSWLSDKIVYEISEEEFGLEALKLAEKKVKYFAKKQ
ncbi:Helix-turn-helix domain-containing protein [Saccharicrinis carchari]|uniref:Helix-turn-helix domain-containing protein n=1 Tax=Saccharicrinis carchari TaxID=1168039 RepID=A0A521DIW8_SACCC|nr:helix-turn-helix transcriptional regulator [Saccharicrinis carchari]SMO71673.1 Helix-turn-helix domain-containing protein [Saccharicrinis carchari]